MDDAPPTGPLPIQPPAPAQNNNEDEVEEEFEDAPPPPAQTVPPAGEAGRPPPAAVAGQRATAAMMRQALFDAGLSVEQMLNDLNGTRGFSEDRAALGTVHRSYFLQLPSGLRIPDRYAIGTDPFLATYPNANDRRFAEARFLWLNMSSMLAAPNPVRRDAAMFGSLLRMNAVKAGVVAGSLESRAVYVDEYTWRDEPLTVDGLRDLSAPSATLEYVNQNWLQIVALARHLFITRGHHYKPEYTDVIDRTWNATTIEAPQGVILPGWDFLLSGAIHWIGPRAMMLVCEHAKNGGRLAASFINRYDAAPAGTAPIRTGWAAIESMKMATWWRDFYNLFHREVDALEVAKNRTAQLGLQAHVNAKLFDWTWTRTVVSDEPVRPLAPWIMGFLDSLDKDEAIKGQKAIDKRASGGVIIRQQFTMVILNEQKNARFMQSVQELLVKAGENRPALRAGVVQA